VVLVDMQIAVDFQRNVDQRMLGELLDHVIEKADAGGYVVRSRPVEIDLDENFRFRCVALDTACSHGARARAARGYRQEIAPYGVVKPRLKRLTRAPRGYT
jgi:hypothetical protein